MLECQSGTDVAHAGAPNVARTGCAGRYGIWISVHVTMHAKPNSSRTIIPAEVLVAKRQQRKTEKRGGKVDVTPELGRRGRPAAALAPPPRLARRGGSSPQACSSSSLRRSRPRRRALAWVVENLAVAQLPLHVAHDALSAARPCRWVV